jgi:hypothetical protein
MTSVNPYLLDELENSELLEIDGLYSWQFSLDEAVLDQADAAAEADLPFASDATLLRIELLDGRDQRKWKFSYNDVLEAVFQPETNTWLISAGEQQHVLKCRTDVAASADNQD